MNKIYVDAHSFDNRKSILYPFLEVGKEFTVYLYNIESLNGKNCYATVNSINNTDNSATFGIMINGELHRMVVNLTNGKIIDSSFSTQFNAVCKLESIVIWSLNWVNPVVAEKIQFN